MSFMMKAALSAALSLGLVAPVGLFAGPENQRTKLTVNRAIEVPGATLQPGEYTIQLAGSEQANDVVIFRKADSQEAVATAMTISTKPDEIPSETEFTFYETNPGDPPVLRAWFFPGDSRGHQFVYPESRSKAVAKTSRRHVPTASDEEYKKLSSSASEASAASENDTEPVLLAVRTVTVYTMTPDERKSTMEEGAKWNREADEKSFSPDRYMARNEMARSGDQQEGQAAKRDMTASDNAINQPTTRVERQIRKEIVTLPYYSIWDHIEYQVDGDGDVTLTGSVYRPSMKKSVERVVEDVEGVKSIQNNIEVQPTSPNDDQIRQAAYRAIYGHTALQNYQLRAVPPIHIIVENGKLTLEGVVQNKMDKQIAGTQANSVSGVFEVTNNLRTES